MTVVNYYLAKLLKEKGFSRPCPCTNVYHLTEMVKPEILEKYKYLSDEGIYELTKDGGGELEWSDVYWQVPILKLTRDIDIESDTFVLAPTIEEVLEWFRCEYNIHIAILSYQYGYNYVIERTPGGNDGGTSLYSGIDHNNGTNSAGCWDDYTECLLHAIDIVICNYLFKN